MMMTRINAKRITMLVVILFEEEELEEGTTEENQFELRIWQ